MDGGGVRGSRKDIGRSVVLPALRDAGIRHLQAVALSHAHFDHGGGLSAILEEHGLAAEEGQLLLRRTLGNDGRSRAFVNDQPVSVSLLRRLGDGL